MGRGDQKRPLLPRRPPLDRDGLRRNELVGRLDEPPKPLGFELDQPPDPEEPPHDQPPDPLLEPLEPPPKNRSLRMPPRPALSTS